MSNVDSNNATCNARNCIPDELVLNKKGTDTKQALGAGEIPVEHRLAVVLIAFIAIWILDIYCIFIVKLETGDHRI